MPARRSALAGADQRVGSLGDVGVFAFYPNKQMTTGEGGMLVTNDPALDQLFKSLRNQGRGEAGAWLQHERLGFNYRLSDINCALGLAQLGRLETILRRRRDVAESIAGNSQTSQTSSYRSTICPTVKSAGSSTSSG